MKASIIAVTSLAFLASVALAAAPAPVPTPPTPSTPPPALPSTPVITIKAPNLVPIASRMKNGTISVRNTGSASAGAFKVTVECNAMGRRGGCAEPPKGAAAAYSDGAFPNKLTVLVPSLAQGTVFNHKITFWDALVWSSGNYEFIVVADASGVVAETNEGDNIAGSLMNVP